MSSHYRFPRIRFIDSHKRIDVKIRLMTQIYHTESEMMEVRAELYSSDFSVNRFSRELLDLIHSAETCLRITEECAGVDVDSVAIDVIQGNRERGYYD